MVTVTDIHGTAIHLRLLTPAEARARYRPARDEFVGRAVWHFVRRDLGREGTRLMRLVARAYWREAGR